MQEDLHQRSEGNLCPQPEIITYTLINYSVHYIFHYYYYYYYFIIRFSV